MAIPKAAYDSQLASAIASYKAQGVDIANVDKLALIKKEVLVGLVNNELVDQGIAASGIETNLADIEKQFQLLVTQAGGAEGLKAQLVNSNITEAQLRENIARQLTVQAYISQNVDMKSISASDAEVKTFYDNYSKQQKASGVKTVPTLKSLTSEIKQQLVLNKQQELVASFLTALQSKAKIVVPQPL